MILQKRKGIKVSNIRIRQFMAKTGVWDAFEVNLVQGAVRHLKVAHWDYRITKKDATMWHGHFLQLLAEVRAAKKHTTIDNEFKQLTRRVEHKRTKPKMSSRI
jgi:hypothetical protein